MALALEGVRTAIVLGGLALAFGGLWFYEVTVSIVGFVIGASAGFFLANAGIVVEAPPELLELGLFVLVGGFLGVSFIWMVLRFVVMMPGFVAGVVLTRVYLGIEFEGLVGILAILVGGFIGASLAWAIHEFMIAVVSAFVGATMVTLGLAGDDIVEALVRTAEEFLTTAEGLVTAGSSELFVPAYASSGIFLAVFLLGVLSQLGGRHHLVGAESEAETE